jgi:hypothetical protein
VSAATWTVAGVVKHPAFAEPHGVIVSPDGRTVFVSSHGVQTGPTTPTPADTMHAGMHAGAGAPRGAGTLVRIDARTRAVRDVTPVGRYATALGLGGS